MSLIRMMQTVARTELLELGPLSDEQLLQVNATILAVAIAIKGEAQLALIQKMKACKDLMDSQQESTRISIEEHGLDNNPYLDSLQTRLTEAQIEYRLMCDLVSGVGV